MDKDNFYFLTGGFISFLLFFFFMAIFFVAIIMPDKEKSYALQKENFISVSMNTVQAQAVQEKKKIDTPVEKKEIKEVPIEKETQKETVAKIEKKEINFDNLFSQVKTKSTKETKEVIKEEQDKRVTQELSKKTAPSDVSKVESLSAKIEKIKSQNKSDKESKSSAGSEVNEYLAKIQALVYEHFSPPENTQGERVRAVIELDAFGRLVDFRILTYSGSNSLNSECDKIKERIKNLLFPKNPDNKSGAYIINLVSEE